MSMMYQAYQNHMDLTAPWRTGAASALKYLNLVPQGVSDRLFGRLAAALELISRSSLTYTRPAYGIDKVMVGNQRIGGDRGSRLRDAVRLAAAFQEGEGAGAAAPVAGGADVRPFRDAAARHREDAAAGPRRLHHRLAQSARHSARRTAGSASTTIPSTSSPSSTSSGPRAHMVAICQPSVSALAAAAIMCGGQSSRRARRR